MLNQKGFIPLLVIITLTVILVTGVVVLFAFKDQLSLYSTRETSNNIPRSSVKPETPSNLQDFTSYSGTYAYTTKYPKDYFIFGETGGCNSFIDNNTKNTHPPDEGTQEYTNWLKEVNNTVSVDVCVFGLEDERSSMYNQNLTIRHSKSFTIDDGYTSYEISSITPLTVNGYDVYTGIAAVNDKNRDSVKGQIYIIENPYGTGFATIRGDTNSDTQKGKELIEVILQNFKFLDTNPPTTAVYDYYSHYLKCKGNSGLIIETCVNQGSFSIDPELVKKIVSTSDFDSVVCNKKTPSGFTVENGQLSGNLAAVTVNTYFGEEKSPSILVSLKYKSPDWVITGIVCPKY